MKSNQIHGYKKRRGNSKYIRTYIRQISVSDQVSKNFISLIPRILEKEIKLSIANDYAEDQSVQAGQGPHPQGEFIDLTSLGLLMPNLK